MTEQELIDFLRQFEVTQTRPMGLVETTMIENEVVPLAIRDKLLDYHPETGADFAITAPVVVSGLDSYLRLEPQGTPWNLDQRTLLGQLKFVPRLNPVGTVERGLIMLRSGQGNIRVGTSDWYLVNACVDGMEGDPLNSVSLLWEYRDPTGTAPYLRPAVSIWQW